MKSTNEKTLNYPLVLLVDVLLVFVFVAIGRSSHGESLSPGFFFTTAWPFVTALLLGHLAVQSWRRPLGIWPQAVMIWAITLVGAMVLRLLSQQGVQLTFVLVAGVFLALFLLGWRLIASKILKK